MYTTHIKHSWDIQIFNKIDVPSGIDNQSEVKSFLDRQMNTPGIQARVQWSFEELFRDIQLDKSYLDQINNPFQLAQLSLSSTNEFFASQARDKFLNLTWGDQSYLDELSKIYTAYNWERKALLATSQFAGQTHAILNTQA